MVQLMDKVLLRIRRPSELKRPTKRWLPKSGNTNNLLSGHKAEDHIHSMETFEPITFYKAWKASRPRWVAAGVSIELVDSLYHLYFRFVSCAMFLFRGSNGLRVLESDPPEKLDRNNAIIARRRANFEADVTVLCILVERHIGAKGCTPNLHSLFCAMTHLVRMKGHPKFELMIERLVSPPPSCPLPLCLVIIRA